MNKKFDLQFFYNILNGINSNLYITDVETDEIVYMNDHCKQAFQLTDPEGKVCWKVLQKGMTKRCDFCKVDKLKNIGEGPVSYTHLGDACAFWKRNIYCSYRRGTWYSDFTAKRRTCIFAVIYRSSRISKI